MHLNSKSVHVYSLNNFHTIGSDWLFNFESVVDHLALKYKILIGLIVAY